MLELASAGAKVLQSRSVEFAGKYKVPLRVLSSFEPDTGTLIFYDSGEHMEQPLVSGIAYQKDEAKLTIRGIPDQPGVAHRVLGPISSANINVDIIIQNLGADGATDMTFTVPREDFDSCKTILENTAKELGAAEVLGDSSIAKIAVVGVGMRSHSGVADTMFKALADEGINIQMISTSEIKISVVIDDRYLELAVRALHKAFGLAEG
jgi:aspartate kinase